MDILPTDNKNQECPTYNKKHYWENLFAFHAKDITNYKNFIYDKNKSFHPTTNNIDCSLFNNFYFLSRKYGTTKSDIDGIISALNNFLVDRQHKIKNINSETNFVLITNITRKEHKDNYKKLLNTLKTNLDENLNVSRTEEILFSNNLSLYLKNILFISPKWFKQEASLSDEIKIKINSSLVEFNEHNNRIFIFNNSDENSLFILTLLNKILTKIKESYTDKTTEYYRLIYSYKKIKENIILNDFGLEEKLPEIKEMIKTLSEKVGIEDDKFDEQIGSIFDKLPQQIEGFVFNFIIEQIQKYKYKYIYVNNSKYYIKQSKKEDFIDNLKENLQAANINVHVEDFDKNYPISTRNSKETLIINIGQDFIINYFIGKLDILFVTDIFSYKKIINHIKYLNSIENSIDIVKYENKNINDLLNQIAEIDDEIEKMFYDDELNSQNKFILTHNNQKHILNGSKKIFYSIDENKTFEYNSLEEIYNMGYYSFNTFFLDNMNELKIVWESINTTIAKKKKEIRKKIKSQIVQKLKYNESRETNTKKRFLSISFRTNKKETR